MAKNDLNDLLITSITWNNLMTSIDFSVKMVNNDLNDLK